MTTASTSGPLAATRTRGSSGPLVRGEGRIRAGGIDRDVAFEVPGLRDLSVPPGESDALSPPITLSWWAVVEVCGGGPGKD